ncbi:MAG: UvrD-helicase domain-containing protein, partial [Myxococcales bacterium]|nr:UvrD-helicase domain-containing protein [Myxococcales bacterium]
MSLPDAEARRAIREDLGATLFVEAAAGTGKTTALVERLVALLKTGAAELGRIVAVTFTEKAAGEMKLRVRGAIEAARRDPETTPEERSRLEVSLGQLELARITTIHAFCGDLLHERPVEAGVDPRFGVAP